MRCALAPSMARPFYCPRTDRHRHRSHRRHSITSVDEDPEQAPITRTVDERQLPEAGRFYSWYWASEGSSCVTHCNRAVRCFEQQVRDGPCRRADGRRIQSPAMWQLVAPARRRKRDSAGPWQIQFS